MNATRMQKTYSLSSKPMTCATFAFRISGGTLNVPDLLGLLDCGPSSAVTFCEWEIKSAANSRAYSSMALAKQEAERLIEKIVNTLLGIVATVHVHALHRDLPWALIQCFPISSPPLPTPVPSHSNPWR